MRLRNVLGSVIAAVMMVSGLSLVTAPAASAATFTIGDGRCQFLGGTYTAGAPGTVARCDFPTGITNVNSGDTWVIPADMRVNAQYLRVDGTIEVQSFGRLTVEAGETVSTSSRILLRSNSMMTIAPGGTFTNHGMIEYCGADLRYGQDLLNPGFFYGSITANPPTQNCPCPPGSYGSFGTCPLASPGSFVATSGAASATTCPVGSYQPNSGATSCLLADPDYFVDTTGATQQTPCPTGTTSLAGANSCTAAPVPPPGVSIDDVSNAEGNSGTSTFTFTVTLDAAYTEAVTVDYATSDGSALSATDYVTTSGTATLAAGTTSQQVSVSVNGDTTVEPDETFTVDLANPVNATLTDTAGTGTITNDDVTSPPPPGLSISDVYASEGDSGTSTFTFTLTLDAAYTEAVTVDYATSNGSALSATDYVTTSGTATLPAGTTSQQVSVSVNGDTTVEPDETFTVDLANPVNATLTDTAGTGTITNDDRPPATFGGFVSPVTPPSGVNIVQAGQSIPVEFGLGGDYGLSIFQSGYPAWVPMSCTRRGTATPAATPENASVGSLAYSSATGKYTYTWKTDKKWKGRCSAFVVKFNDGAIRYHLLFQFKESRHYTAPPSPPSHSQICHLRRHCATD